MAPSSLTSKVLHHGRSLSLSFSSHPAISQFDENLSTLRCSEGASSSLSSMNCMISGLRKLYDSIDDLLLLPHVQQIISEKCVDDCIRLLDGCITVKDLISFVKQGLRDLVSAVRRKDARGINSYLTSRKTSNKMIQKSLKNLRRCASASSEKASEERNLVSMLKDAEFVAFSVLESLLAYTLGTSMQERKNSWSFLSKTMQSKKVSNEENEFNKMDSFLQQNQEKELMNHIKEMDSGIQVVEEELDCIFGQLIKTRVSLLNFLNH